MTTWLPEQDHFTPSHKVTLKILVVRPLQRFQNESGFNYPPFLGQPICRALPCPTPLPCLSLSSILPVTEQPVKWLVRFCILESFIDVNWSHLIWSQYMRCDAMSSWTTQNMTRSRATLHIHASKRYTSEITLKHKTHWQMPSWKSLFPVSFACKALAKVNHIQTTYEGVVEPVFVQQSKCVGKSVIELAQVALKMGREGQKEYEHEQEITGISKMKFMEVLLTECVGVLACDMATIFILSPVPRVARLFGTCNWVPQMWWKLHAEHPSEFVGNGEIPCSSTMVYQLISSSPIQWPFMAIWRLTIW